MNLYRIGEASARSGIPASTLRYYDQIGLLRPANPDAANQYRYYSDDDITLITAIEMYHSCNLFYQRVTNNLPSSAIASTGIHNTLL